MNWLIVPIEDLKEFDPFWENRRVSVDGKHAITHETIYNNYIPNMLLENEEIQYPYELISDEKAIQLMNTKEWTNEE